MPSLTTRRLPSPERRKRAELGIRLLALPRLRRETKADRFSSCSKMKASWGGGELRESPWMARRSAAAVLTPV